jgi:hypothetical protein
MKATALLLSALAACASSQMRGPECSVPADRVEIQQVQVGWNRLSRAVAPAPIVDPRVTNRTPEDAEALAKDLLAKCRNGEAMEPLQDRYSEVPGGTIVVGPRADLPFKSGALCMQKGECAVVRSDVAFHVLKRVN